jgi:hypothetical protein
MTLVAEGVMKTARCHNPVNVLLLGDFDQFSGVETPD